METPETTQCPCKSGAIYANCCGRFIAGLANPPTALELMRSRYSAYCLGRVDYLVKTWHPSTGPEAVDPADRPKWINLAIIKSEGGGQEDLAGTVEFKAHYLHQNRKFTLHEISRFVKEGGRWLYLDGDLIGDGCGAGAKTVGRNNPCPCGSGRKFKRCCGP